MGSSNCYSMFGSCLSSWPHLEAFGASYTLNWTQTSTTWFDWIPCTTEPVTVKRALWPFVSKMPPKDTGLKSLHCTAWTMLWPMLWHMLSIWLLCSCCFHMLSLVTCIQMAVQLGIKGKLGNGSPEAMVSGNLPRIAFLVFSIFNIPLTIFFCITTGMLDCVWSASFHDWGLPNSRVHESRAFVSCSQDPMSLMRPAALCAALRPASHSDSFLLFLLSLQLL